MPFTPKTMDFLMENRLRNSRLWYQEHKEAYQTHVLAPMQELVGALEPYALTIDGGFVTEAKVGKTICRIYRDTRFTKDKTLFREVQWCTFKRDKHLYPGYPALYLEFSPNHLRYGCGFYGAEPASMEILRELVLSDDGDYKKAAAALKKAQKLGFTLQGDRYKRSKFPNESEEKRLWLDSKSIYLSKLGEDLSLLFSPDLGRVVGEELLPLAPIYDFFCKVQQLKLQRERSLNEGRTTPRESDWE